MSHLSPDELVDAVEESLSHGRRAHVHECHSCRERVMQLSALLSETRTADVPEPSPLFWDRFSDQVRSAIAADWRAPRVTTWFQWPVLAPVAALGLLVFALASAVPQVRIEQGAAVARNDNLIATEVVLADAFEDNWAVVSELVGELDVETAQQAGIAVAPGSAEGVVLQLSSAEQQELLRLLRAELRRAGS